MARLAVAALLVALAASPASAEPPSGVPRKSWDVTRRWIAAMKKQEGAALAKLSPDGLYVTVSLDAGTRFSRACRKLAGKTLRGKRQLAKLARCLVPQLRGDHLRAESPDNVTQPPDVFWAEPVAHCDSGDWLLFDVVVTGRRRSIAGVIVHLTDACAPL
jgi:hypothetical protein